VHTSRGTYNEDLNSIRATIAAPLAVADAAPAHGRTMPPKTAKEPAAKKPAAKKPAAKGVKKTTATKTKKAATKKKKTAAKKSAAAKKKKASEDKELLTKYDLHGQKRDTPDEADPLRKFYASLRVQNPKSVMAETWLMEHGLLESAEEQKNAYARFLKSKGRAVPKMTVKKVAKTEGGVDGAAAEVKIEVKPEPTTATTTVVDDDDSDDDVPLANRKPA